MKTNLDLFTNYNSYILCNNSCKVEEPELRSVINNIQAVLKKPYIRFMLCSGVDKPMCVVYENKTRVTKLMPFCDIESQITKQAKQ